MRQLSRLLEHSIASLNDTPGVKRGNDFEKRRQAIANLSNPVKRIGASLIHQYVAMHTDYAKKLHRNILEKSGLMWVGEGADAVVYCQGQSALKLYKHTAQLSEPARADFRNHHEYTGKVLRKYLGNMVLLHDFRIAPHPVTEDTVVQGIQPFVAFTAESSAFNKKNLGVDYERMAALEKQFPGSAEALQGYARQSLELYTDTGYLPDTYAQDNLVIGTQTGSVTNELLLIDTYPHYVAPNAELDMYEDCILGQLHSLANLKQAIAA